MKNWREKSQKKGDVIGFMIDYFEKNKEWMNQQVRLTNYIKFISKIQSNPSDAYWQNVELILQQYQVGLTYYIINYSTGTSRWLQLSSSIT